VWYRDLPGLAVGSGDLLDSPLGDLELRGNITRGEPMINDPDSNPPHILSREVLLSTFHGGK